MCYPEVTVVVSCFNHERFVRHALETVAKQTYPNLFVIVTDDASTDASAAAIEQVLAGIDRPSLFLRNRSNRGFPATLNDAMHQFRGSYVNIMSADDWMEPTHIEKKVERLEVLGPEYAMCYSDAFRADESGSRYGPTMLQERFGDRVRPSGWIFADLVQGNFIPAHSVVVRRSVFDEVGKYDTTLVAEDYDMFLRISRSALVALVPEPLVTYRSVQESLFRRTGLTRKRMDEIDALSKHLGVDRELDVLLHDKIALLARALYRSGRSATLTRRDLRPVLGRTPRLENVAYFAAASCGMSWETLRTIATAGGRLRR